MSEHEACNAAFRAWADSLDREDSEGDPREIISGAARAMWNAGRDWQAAQAGDESTVARLRAALERIEAILSPEAARGDVAVDDAFGVVLDALTHAPAPGGIPIRRPVFRSPVDLHPDRDTND